MNVFWHELRFHGKSALLWALAVSALGFVLLTVFPAFSKDVDALMRVLQSYPDFVLKAIGIDSAALNSFNGYYSFMVVYPILCAAVQGLIFGMCVISKEGARRTSDFLFGKPASRQRILLEKLLAVLALTLGGAACYTGATYASCLLNVTDLDREAFLLFSGAYALTQVFCLSIGFCIGCCVRRIKSPNAVGIGLGALFFTLLMVDNLSNERSFAFLSPLSYLNPAYIAVHRAYDMPYLWALIALSVALPAVGVIRFAARDIHGA